MSALRMRSGVGLVAAQGRRRASRPALLAAELVVLLIALAALAPGLFTSADPLATDPAAAVLAPSADHWLGTDQQGRDVFARVVHGARASLEIGVGATLVAVTAGVLLGLGAALAGRWIATPLLRLVEVLLAFPGILLALLVISIVGNGTREIALAIAVGAAPGYARIVRAETLRVRSAGFVESSIALGVAPGRIVGRHLLPNVVRPLLVLATIGLGETILAGSALSFLGMGPKPPTPEWGSAIADGRDYLATAWWISFAPGAAIVATVVAVTVVGRGWHARLGGGR
ncbi:ABC transporter permease [Conexibacter stalactiti]|uniref:ABC transporter permease n=1 Tax=Conexibacter stalactiti TaxID=1940611 RepID=A0ABU4HWE9_9ACTN|nr:ABC transporter permease [Conexibacter stalactiti]MDW5596840.1 ABC transporter permease [Conexibacter stalactiti]MEC5037482.1 ABC transporter permease [Conexibacter stalactiti]